MRWLVAMATVAASLSALQRDAEACSCDPPPNYPGNGAVDAPLNTRLVVQSWYRDRWTNYRLVRQSDGSVVSSSIERRDRPNGQDRLYVVTPDDDLQPETIYEFVVDAFESERVVSSFTTGTHRLTEPPAYTGLLEMELETVLVSDVPFEMQHSCFGSSGGWWSRINTRVGERGDGVSFVQLEWYPVGGASEPVDWMMAAGGIVSGACSISPPPLVPGSTWCARSVAYDLAGNSAGGESVVCADVVQCVELRENEEQPWHPICVAKTSGEGPETGGCSINHRPGGACLVLLVLLWTRGRRRTPSGRRR